MLSDANVVNDTTILYSLLETVSCTILNMSTLFLRKNLISKPKKIQHIKNQIPWRRYNIYRACKL